MGLPKAGAPPKAGALPKAGADPNAGAAPKALGEVAWKPPKPPLVLFWKADGVPKPVCSMVPPMPPEKDPEDGDVGV